MKDISYLYVVKGLCPPSIPRFARIGLKTQLVLNELGTRVTITRVGSLAFLVSSVTEIILELPKLGIPSRLTRRFGGAHIHICLVNEYYFFYLGSDDMEDYIARDIWILCRRSLKAYNIRVATKNIESY